MHKVIAFSALELEPIWEEAVSRSLKFLTAGAQRFVEATRETANKQIGFVITDDAQ